MTRSNGAAGPAAFALPRSLFLPPLCWPLTADGYIAVDRREDPETWKRWADADVPIVTQWDDGDHTGREPGTVPTSSASQPTLVAEMLGDLAAAPGQRVLDVGAGTGWTAGLLAAAVGLGLVTGIEVDAHLADAADARLRAIGIDASVIAGDGDAGRPAGAPYDRVQATFAVRRVPYTWVEQTRPGGLIVAPWGTRYSNLNAVARLVVAEDGTASGRFTRPVEFMVHRGQRGTWPRHEDYLPGGEWPAGTRESTTDLPLKELTAAEWQIGACVPDLARTTALEDDGTSLMLYGLSDRSWAYVFWCSDGGGSYDVWQGGSRSLWDEVEVAYGRWDAAGRPDVTRYGLTVSPAGHIVWLDERERMLPPCGPL